MKKRYPAAIAAIAGIALVALLSFGNKTNNYFRKQPNKDPHPSRITGDNRSNATLDEQRRPESWCYQSSPRDAVLP